MGPVGRYQSGDSILFEAGQTFTGTIVVSTINYQATSAMPLTIASYGQGRATINSGTQLGLITITVMGIRISNLNFIGSDPAAGQSGIAFINQSSGALSGFEVTDVEISGYTNGIFLSQGMPPSRKMRDIRINRVKIHDNAAGISFLGSLPGPGSGAVQNNNFYAIENLYIGNGEFYNNTGAGIPDTGYAIFILQADNVTIEHNNIHDNGGNAPAPREGPNGPSAITVYDGRRVVIQSNEISRQRLTRNNETDNAAIDIWSLDSIVQYNYIHDIESWAMTLLAGNPGNPADVFPWPSERMTIRYNIFANNGRFTHPTAGPVLSYALLMSGPLKDFDIYNNVFYTSALPGTPPQGRQAMVQVIHEGSTAPAWNNLRFRNNIFLGDGGDIPFFDVRPIAGVIQIQGNNYSGSTSPRKISWNGQAFSDIAVWSQTTGQERINNAQVASTDDPHFCGPVLSPTANSFKLQAGSPLINRGLDLRSLFGLNVGTRDFFGNPLPEANFDIGANEFVSGQTCDAAGNPPIAGLSKIQVSPNPMRPGDSGVSIFNLPSDQDLKIYNQLGQRVRRFSPAATVFWDGKNDQGEDVSSGIYTGVIDGNDLFKIGVER